MSIIVSNVSKRFGDFVALDDVSVEIPSGSLTALLGPSGGGKSTLLRIIAGLEQPDSGSVVIDGKDATATPVQNRNVGFVFQHYAAFKHMTVFKNVAFGLEIRKWPKDKVRARVTELLELVHLEQFADRYPSQLSGGQRQRMALARALAVEPGVLLLDEPFGALDAQVRQELRRWLRRLHDQVHVTTLFVTHDQEEALEVADSIVVIAGGHRAAGRRARRALRRPGQRLRDELPRAGDPARRRGRPTARHRPGGRRRAGHGRGHRGAGGPARLRDQGRPDHRRPGSLGAADPFQRRSTSPGRRQRSCTPGSLLRLSAPSWRRPDSMVCSRPPPSGDGLRAVLRVSARADYAIRLVVAMACSPGEVLSREHLAQSEGLPVKFVDHVLRQLRNGGLIESRRGRLGGYRLARAAGADLPGRRRARDGRAAAVAGRRTTTRWSVRWSSPGGWSAVVDRRLRRGRRGPGRRDRGGVARLPGWVRPLEPRSPRLRSSSCHPRRPAAGCCWP